MKYLDGKKIPLQCLMTTSTCYQKSYPMKVKGILWHSTGAPNPNIRRYVQPSDNAKNRNELLKLIGENDYNNDWNHIYLEAGVNAFIGKMADGSVTTVQTLPWNLRPWGCGSSYRGSCNDGWIQFEICEDYLEDAEYFNQVYQEACQLTAYLCRKFNLNPNGSVWHEGIQVPVILCHKESNNYGLGSNHEDVLHWSKLFGKDMNTVRKDVARILKEQLDQEARKKAEEERKKQEEEQKRIEKEKKEMFKKEFSELMENYNKEIREKGPSSWSEKGRQFCEEKGLIIGDQHGDKHYKAPVTREEMALMLQRFYELIKN